MSEFKATLIGTLPPLQQGIYLYCFNLYNSLTEYDSFEFFSFKKLYPKLFYPGNSTKEPCINYIIPVNKNIKVKYNLTYYNPFSWLAAGLSGSGRIIHLQFWTTYLVPIYSLILIAAKIKRKKIVITLHNILPHERRFFDVFLTRAIIYFADKIVVHSKRNKEQAELLLKISPNKIIVLPHGTFHQAYFKVDSELSKKVLGIPKNSKVVLFFGTIRDYKGLDTLIKAMVFVTKYDPDILLLIGGKPWIEWQQFQDIIDKNKLNKNVYLFLNYIPDEDVKYFFNAADVVVAPYRKGFAGQSAAGLMSITFNKPLIVSNVGGLPELVLDKKCIFEAEDEKALGEKINEVLGDPDILKKLSEDSKVLAIKYSWDEIAKGTIRLYNEIL